jgi:ketosteroid isomerase-like protein
MVVNMTNAIEVVRRFYVAYQEQDLETARRLLSAGLTFTSPQDDHIDKATYLERCFPTADRFVATDVREAVEAEPGVVLWRYTYELQDGDRFSNVEAITVRDEQIVDIHVYFGGAEN